MLIKLWVTVYFLVQCHVALAFWLKRHTTIMSGYRVAPLRVNIMNYIPERPGAAATPSAPAGPTD